MKSNWSLRNMECIVYLDSYTKVDDSVVDAYVDFRLDRDLVLFRRAMNFQEMSPSYIELRSLKTSKRLFHGCYYKLNLAQLREYPLSRNDNSLLFGGHFNLEEMRVPTSNSDEILQKHDLLDPDELSMRNVPEDVSFSINARPHWELFVKDVGQANWNELCAGDRIEVLYDAGAELHASSWKIGNIFNSRRKDLEQSKPVLVVSHWDIDHIHCLKYLSDQDISSCFSKLICVDKLKSVTSIGILKQFIKALGPQNVFCLPVPARTNGIAMHPWRRCGDITFYQGEKSRNINYCGLTMFVQGQNASANLTGDCRLSQAENVYQQELGLGIKTNKHVLVAPHHGGDCGASFRSYTSPCDNILISVGVNNSYNHPHKDMLAYLYSLGTVERTDMSGDLVKVL